MAHEAVRYVWAIVSPSARLSVAYLDSTFATSAADALDLENGEYLALILWTDNPTDPMEDTTIAYPVQSVTYPLPPTYLPILPCRLGARKPLVPDFRWPFEDCVVDTSRKFIFTHATSASDFRALSPGVSEEVDAVFMADDLAYHERAESEYLATRKAEHDAAGLADDGSVWSAFSAHSTRAAAVPGAFFPPSLISAQVRFDIESFKLSLPASRLLDDERKVKLLRARFSRPSTERTIVWTLSQTLFLHECAPLPDIVPENDNPAVLELLANLDRPQTPDPGEELESDYDEECDSEDDWGYTWTSKIPAYEAVPTPCFDPHGLKVIYFHVHGTLVDHETGIFDALQPLISRSAYGFERHEALSLYFNVEDEVKKCTPSLPYVEILARAYDDLSIRLGLNSTGEEAAVFASSLFTWPLFDGAVKCMRALGPLVLLVGLIDMDLETFQKTTACSVLGLYVMFTWDSCHTYRPDPDAIYPPLLFHDTYGIPRQLRCVVSNAVYRDLEPAGRLEIPTVWIRYPDNLGANVPTEETSFLWNTYENLSEFASDILKHKPCPASVEYSGTEYV